MLKALPAFDLSPYMLTLYGLFLGLSAQALASYLAICQCFGKNARKVWLAFTCAMLFLLRQRWANFEFSLATGVYDSLSAFCDLFASLFLCLAIAGWLADGDLKK
jgi:hypothetical protein